MATKKPRSGPLRLVLPRPRKRLTLAAWLAIALALLPLAACGKRGAPSPPGPPSQVTYPKVYPTQ